LPKCRPKEVLKGEELVGSSKKCVLLMFVYIFSVVKYFVRKTVWNSELFFVTWFPWGE